MVYLRFVIIQSAIKGGILSSERSKLSFEQLKINSAAQNNLPYRGFKTLSEVEVSSFNKVLIMDNQKKDQSRKSGRKPKNDPARHRYSISLNDKENALFLSLFEKSEMKVMAHFITACIFEKTVKTVKVDMNAVEFHTRLTNLYSQFRAIGVNYNQIVKILYRNFSEKKASAYLFKLENQTAELAELCRKILALTLEFEKKHLEK